jgi:hypothetical protein
LTNWIQDEVELEGYKKTLGSQMDFTNEKGGTSWCVKKWEEAGAIVIGKTNMHELGLGMVWPLLDIYSNGTLSPFIPKEKRNNFFGAFWFR